MDTSYLILAQDNLSNKLLGFRFRFHHQWEIELSFIGDDGMKLLIRFMISGLRDVFSTAIPAANDRFVKL